MFHIFQLNLNKLVNESNNYWQLQNYYMKSNIYIHIYTIKNNYFLALS